MSSLEDKAYTIYLTSLIETTKLFLDDDTELYQSKKMLEAKLLDEIRQAVLDNTYEQFLLAEIKIQWAILKMKYGDEFSAFWNLKQAYGTSEQNIETHPDFFPSYKSMGLLNVLFGIVPDKYNWLLSIFGIEGNVLEGLELLSQAAEAQNIYSLESAVMIALLNSYLLNDTKTGLENITQVHKSHKELLIEYSYAVIAMKDGKSQLVIEILNEAQNNHSQPFALPQLYYLMGEALLQKGDTEKAIQNYQLFIKNQPGQSLIKDSYYKIGICHLINDNEASAKKYFDLAEENGWAKNEADIYAKAQIESQNFSNKDLYRLRYATDGGFYKNALVIQSKIEADQLDERNLCEYYYRTGRLMQKTTDNKSAIRNYLKTIEAQQDNRWYYAPNSALQLGIIYHSENEKDEARKYLEMVFEYKNHPYQKSIRQKAKTLLKSLND